MAGFKKTHQLTCKSLLKPTLIGRYIYDAKGQTTFQTSASSQLPGLGGPSGASVPQASRLLGVVHRGCTQIPTTLLPTLHFNSLCTFPILKKIKHVFLVR